MEQLYRAKVNEEGRLSIPAECRKRLGITPGQELILQIDGSGLHLFTPEVATILGRRGMSASPVLADVCKIVGEIRPFDMEQARLSAALDEKTKSLGLSIGDRVCLALGILSDRPLAVNFSGQEQDRTVIVSDVWRWGPILDNAYERRIARRWLMGETALP